MNEVSFRQLISGQRQGIAAQLLRAAMRVLSWPYGWIIRLRNIAFDRGWMSTAGLPVPVISIGNITTGGTGKTPVVAMVVQILQQSGCQPAVISRGYRADHTGSNDEKRVLDQLCPGVPHVQNANRVIAAQQLLNTTATDVIVMDDGFQHRRLHRDLNVVLIDASNPFGYGFVLPRGLLREPLAALRRADIVLLTRTDLATEHQLARICSAVLAQAPQLEGRIHPIRFVPQSLMNVAGEHRSLTECSQLSAYVLCGIGNPTAFVSTCQSLQLTIVGQRHFPDHHHYEAAELEQIRREAAQCGAGIIVTTQKDLVKLPPEARDFWAVIISTLFASPNGDATFRAQLLRTCTKISL